MTNKEIKEIKSQVEAVISSLSRCGIKDADRRARLLIRLSDLQKKLSNNT